MLTGLLGKKLGMTQVFDSGGNRVPVTVIQAGPCRVVQRKVCQRDGYDAVQLGFEEAKLKRITKPLQGYFAKSGVPPMRHLREFRIEGDEDLEIGQVVGVDLFRPGDYVDIVGISKGRGFAGVMKRHGFSGAPASHGTHESFRGPGSIGATSDPGRVFKGVKMAGHMGCERITVQNLRVVQVIKEQNLLMVNGAVPGKTGGIVVVRLSKKKGNRSVAGKS